MSLERLAHSLKLWSEQEWVENGNPNLAQDLENAATALRRAAAIESALHKVLKHTPFIHKLGDEPVIRLCYENHDEAAEAMDGLWELTQMWEDARDGI